MENKDQPINPTPVAGGDESVVSALDASNVKRFHQGLTKREYFAGLAMQGLLSVYDQNEQNPIVPNYDNVIFMAELSVKAADALLSALTVKKTHQL